MDNKVQAQDCAYVVYVLSYLFPDTGRLFRRFQFTLYSIHYTVYTIHYAVYSTQYTLSGVPKLGVFRGIPDKMPENEKPDKMPENKMTDNPYPNHYPRPHPNRSWSSSVSLFLLSLCLSTLSTYTVHTVSISLKTHSLYLSSSLHTHTLSISLHTHFFYLSTYTLSISLHTPPISPPLGLGNETTLGGGITIAFKFLIIVARGTFMNLPVL